MKENLKCFFHIKFSYDDKLNVTFGSVISVLSLFNDKLIVAIDASF
jgi:hypothetical protein